MGYRGKLRHRAQVSVVSRGPSRPDSCLSPAEFPELVSGATGTGDLTRRGRTELGASKMADEALAGLDEGALRKLVSGPIIPTVMTGKLGQRQGLSRLPLS